MKRLLLLTALTLPSLVFAQGVLTPPPGAPAPTMKSLDQIEPRTPIGQVGGSTELIVIDEPGSYVLQGNVSVTAGDAIAITAGNVTLDLNGFMLSSFEKTPSGTAIAINDRLKNITIRNGHIRSGSTLGAAPNGTATFIPGAGFLYGVIIRGSDTENVCIEELGIHGLAGTAINTNYATTVVRRCVVSTCQSGIYSNTVEDCQVRYSEGEAIRCATASNCIGASFVWEGLNASSATNCTGVSTFSTGLLADTATNCKGYSGGDRAGLSCHTAIGCYGYNEAGGIGLAAASATGCVGISTSGTGLFADNATNCRGTSTSGTGLDTNNKANGFTGTATGCTGISDTGHGLIAAIATNCTGRTTDKSKIGVWVSGTATGCRGTNTGATGTGAQSAITCDIAVACTRGDTGTINAGSKQLGTP